jgi:hypothetical protein
MEYFSFLHLPVLSSLHFLFFNSTIFISFHNHDHAIVNDGSLSVQIRSVKFPKTGKTENGANEVREGQKGENTALPQDDWP